MSNQEKEILEEEVVTVIKDNKLDVLEVGTTVYVPYISIVDNVYEVRECIIESIGDFVEKNVISIFYNCKVSNTDEEGETMTLNILANISTSPEEAEEELKSFLSLQLETLAEHTDSIKEQLKKNEEHIAMFTSKVK